VCVIDEDRSPVVQEKVRNELPRINRLIEPFKETLQIVAESTFNWYWLVDSLQDAGYQVSLSHTARCE
jgi:transposase